MKSSEAVTFRVLSLAMLLVACGQKAEPKAKPVAAEPEERVADAGPSGPPKRIFAKRFVVTVRSAPNKDAPRIGYLRAGAVLQAKTARPVGRDGCPGGWYELETGGFVCNARDVTAFDGKKLPERPPAQPDRDASIPYKYGITRREGAPLYRRLPTDLEAAQFEGYKIPGLDAGIPDPTATDPAPATDPATATEPATEPATATPATDPGTVTTATATDPAADIDAGPPTLDSLRGERDSALARRLVKGFYVSLDRDIHLRDRHYWKTISNGFVPFNRLAIVQTTSFQGVALDEQTTAPVGFVMSARVRTYRKDARGRMKGAGFANFHYGFSIASEEQIGGRGYYVSHDGRYFRTSDVRKIATRPRPEGVQDTEQWIDVDLATQSLVAYEGDKPVYITLISSGRISDNPELNFPTPTGEFRITGKHLATTMDGDHAVDGPYSIEDVPYVMYFEMGYALHSAFWHNRFGHTRSHGCVNLAPKDAKWIFEWSTPHLPIGWHSAYPTEQQPGTRIYIHGEPPR